MNLSDELLARLLAAVGLDENADAETLVAAVEDLASPQPDQSKVAAAAEAAGLAVVDEATLETLRADAERGRVLAAEARKREVAAVVDEAISTGRIPPARRDAWTTILAADPAMAQTLKAMPQNLVPVVELGHSIGSDDEHALLEQPSWFR